MSKKSEMYSIKAMVWESMHLEITPLENRDNIKEYESNQMAQEGLHRGIMINIKPWTWHISS